MGKKLKEDFTEVSDEYFIRMSFTLSTEAEAMKFVRASEDIELMLPDTKVQMYNFADYVKGDPPPPRPDGNHAMNEHWDLLVGIITGPRTKDLPDMGLNAKDTDWARSVIEILEFYGLKEQQDMLH